MRSRLLHCFLHGTITHQSCEASACSHSAVCFKQPGYQRMHFMAQMRPPAQD